MIALVMSMSHLKWTCFFNLRNGRIELNGSIDLLFPSNVKCKNINGNSHVSLQPNGGKYSKLNSNPAPVIIPLIQIPDDNGLSGNHNCVDEIRSKETIVKYGVVWW